MPSTRTSGRRTAAAAPLSVLTALVLLGGCARHEAPTAMATSPEPANPPAKATDMPATPATLVINDLKPGAGAAIAAGQTAVVQYTGWLYSAAAPDHKGTKFDSSRDHGEPFSFRVGGGEVIAGWDQGVAGMKAGGERQLVIPPQLGYGAQGAGGVIPPNATLVFDVELVSIR